MFEAEKSAWRGGGRTLAQPRTVRRRRRIRVRRTTRRTRRSERGRTVHRRPAEEAEEDGQAQVVVEAEEVDGLREEEEERVSARQQNAIAPNRACRPGANDCDSELTSARPAVSPLTTTSVLRSSELSSERDRASGFGSPSSSEHRKGRARRTSAGSGACGCPTPRAGRR